MTARVGPGAWQAGVLSRVSSRLQRRIERDFPASGSAASVAEIAAAVGESERVQAAVVLWGRGDLDRVRDACELAGQDWRDVPVRADLAGEDWRSRLDPELGPVSKAVFVRDRAKSRKIAADPAGVSPDGSRGRSQRLPVRFGYEECGSQPLAQALGRARSRCRRACISAPDPDRRAWSASCWQPRAQPLLSQVSFGCLRCSWMGPARSGTGTRTRHGSRATLGATKTDLLMQPG